LSIGGREAAKRSVVVAGDPDIGISDADRKAHFDTLVELHRLHGAANSGAAAVTKASDQLSAANKALDDGASGHEALKKTIEETLKKLEPVRRKFGVAGGGGFGRGRENVRGTISQLKGSIMASTSRPTEVQGRLAAQARADLETAIDEANIVLAGLPAIFKELAEKNIYPSVPGAIGKIPR